MNRRVYLLAGFLVLVAGGVMTAKVIYGGHTVRQEFSRHLWRIHVVMNLAGQGTRAKVRLTLPQDTERQTVYNEHFENDELVFYVRERPLTGNRMGFWRSEVLDGSKSIQYTFSVQLRSLAYEIPQALKLPTDPLAAYPPELQAWLDPSKFIQSRDISIKKHVKNVIGRERKAAAVVRRLYDYVRGEVQYRSEKGSKDARETLNKLTADCGGQARLFAALSRAAGIPSRVVGGLVLTVGAKNTTHVWVENYLGRKWIPFDVVNDHFAFIPTNYVELYRGDYFLVKHLGLTKFDYFFVIGMERLPPVDHPWSLYVLPIHFQSFIQVLLLIPIGALVVAFFRTVIGVPTFGTFAPVLLALAFRESSFQIGVLVLGVIIFFGSIVRSILDRLKILVVPRLSVIVTLVVAFVLGMVVVAFHMGVQKIFYFSFFPMVIMTWLIERFSVIQIEDGTGEAFKTALGTALVALAAYYLMGRHAVRTYLFAFPELLLVIMGVLLLLGRYTGIRVTELWRFQELRKLRQRKVL